MGVYQNTKPASVAWLGIIPSHWKCMKVGSLFSERKQKVSDKDYAPLSVAKIGVVPQLDTAVKTVAGDNRKLVCTGDFVINSRSDRKGSCGVSQLAGSVSLINIVLTPRNEWNNQYVHYLMRSHSFSEEYYRYGRGIVSDLWTTRFSEMKNILLPVPPRAEQDQIVRFLDWKVSGINRLINLKKKEIAELKEQLRVIIDHTFRKAMSATELEDSSYPWIGAIPKTWCVRPFGRIASVKANLCAPDEYPDYPQISPASIEKHTGKIVSHCTVKESGVNSANHRFFQGQLLFSKIRPRLNKVAIAPYDGLCSAEVYPIETELLTPYLQYYMLSSFFNRQYDIHMSDRARMPKLNKEELSTFEVIIPPVEAQEDIVEGICRQTRQADEFIENITKQIDALVSLRIRLISDTVTGKIDVRNIEIPEYEFVDEASDSVLDEENESTDEEQEEEA